MAVVTGGQTLVDDAIVAVAEAERQWAGPVSIDLHEKEVFFDGQCCPLYHLHDPAPVGECV